MSVVVRWRAVLDFPLPLVVQVLYVSGHQVEGCSGFPLPLVVQVLYVSGPHVEGCSGLSVTSCSAGVVCQWSSGGGLFWIMDCPLPGLSITSCSACAACQWLSGGGLLWIVRYLL